MYFVEKVTICGVYCALRHFLSCICVIFLCSHPRGSLPAECVFRTGSGRGTGLSSGTSRGRGHSDFGWAVLSWEIILNLNLFETLLQSAALNLFVSPCRTELGCDPERRQRRCPRQLLPQSKQTGVASVVKWAEFIIFVQNLNVSSCACVLDRSRWEWSLKPVPEHRRPQPPLGTRWSSPRPTWCFEVINFYFYIFYDCVWTNIRFYFVCLFVSPASRDDKQPVHHRRSVGEASNAAASHPDHGGFCEPQRGQAAGWPRRHRGMTLHLLGRTVRIMIWTFRVPLPYQNTSGLSDASQPAA